uniref:Uncharacterized protein n=1 Tax=Phasianus colchicus TaxID=9054 RepID=A0A669PDE5_PHACC
MAARGGEKEPPDAVHLNRLLCERVRKELRCQRLHTEHTLRPHRFSSSSHGHSEAHVLARQHRGACGW